MPKYLHERDYLQNGELPPAYDPKATTTKELCNEFLAAKESLVESGELTKRTWDDYKRTCDYILKHFRHSRHGELLREIRVPIVLCRYRDPTPGLHACWIPDFNLGILNNSYARAAFPSVPGRCRRWQK